jgi:hypothetical protein
MVYFSQKLEHAHFVQKNSAGREILYRVGKLGAFLSSWEPGQRRRRWRQMSKTAVKSYVSTALSNM